MTLPEILPMLPRRLVLLSAVLLNVWPNLVLAQTATPETTPPVVLPTQAPAQILNTQPPAGPSGVAGPEGLAGFWASGDQVSHATLLILVAMSVASWTVLAIKLVEQTRLLRQARAALADRLPASGPFHALALAGQEALGAHDGPALTVDRHTWLSLGLNRALARAISQLQGGMSVLATVASTSPFVGLFGTVWGIHHALTAIGQAGQASIDKVAGPVGEALVMTAIGLAVAVPAVLAYNWLGRRNKVIADSLRDRAGHWHMALLAGRVGVLPQAGAARAPLAQPLSSRTA